MTGAKDFLPKVSEDRRFMPLIDMTAPNFHKQARAADLMAKQMDAAMLAAGHTRGVHDEWLNTSGIASPTEPLSFEKLERMIEALPPMPEPATMFSTRRMLDIAMPIVEPREWVISHGTPRLKPMREIETVWRQCMSADGFVEVEPGEWFNEKLDMRIWRDELPIGSVNPCDLNENRG